MAKRKIKVLFIDDEPDACKLFKRLVEGKGYRAFTATDVKKGLALYKKELPKIVFLDIVMPDADGIELLKKIRKINPRQIVIILTGYGDLGRARAAMRFGAYDFVSKPLSITVIIDSIKDALALKNA